MEVNESTEISEGQAVTGGSGRSDTKDWTKGGQVVWGTRYPFLTLIRMRDCKTAS